MCICIFFVIWKFVYFFILCHNTSYVAQIALKSLIFGGVDDTDDLNTILNCTLPKLPVGSISYLTSANDLSLTGIDSVGVASINDTSVISNDEPPSKTLLYKSTLEDAGRFTFMNTVIISASSFNSTFLVIYLVNSDPPDADVSAT